MPDVTIAGASYTNVSEVDLPQTGGGTARFVDVSDTTAVAADVASGKKFYLADGSSATGTASGGGGGGLIYTNQNLLKHYTSKVFFKDFSTTTLSTTATNIISAKSASNLGITFSSSKGHYAILNYYACFKYLNTTVTTLGISYPLYCSGFAILEKYDGYLVSNSGTSSAGFKMSNPYMMSGNPTSSATNGYYFASEKPFPYTHFLGGYTADGTETCRSWSSTASSNSIYGIYPYISAFSSTTVVPVFRMRCISSSAANYVNFPTSIQNYIDFDNSYLIMEEDVYEFDYQTDRVGKANVMARAFCQANKDDAHFPAT